MHTAPISNLGVNLTTKKLMQFCILDLKFLKQCSAWFLILKTKKQGVRN